MPLCSLLKNVLGKYWVTSELTHGCLIENEVTAAVTLFLVEPHPSLVLPVCPNFFILPPRGSSLKGSRQCIKARSGLGNETVHNCEACPKFETGVLRCGLANDFLGLLAFRRA